MSPQENKISIAFDLYGTILSTESVAKDLETHFGEDKAQTIAAKWRQYQLEYTWRIRNMGAYAPFDKITRASLQHAVNEQGLTCPDSVADALMQSYDSLAVFPDVLPALKTLQSRRGPDSSGGGGGGGGGRSSSSGSKAVNVHAVVFSNGTEKMLSSSVNTSPDLMPFQSKAEDGQAVFRKLITVDGLKTFKPDPKVYEHLQAEAVPADWRGQAAMWLVSANAFDVVGARDAGLRAAWIDRAGKGWVDRLGEVVSDVSGGKRNLTPTLIAAGVDRAVEEILKVGI